MYDMSNSAARKAFRCKEKMIKCVYYIILLIESSILFAYKRADF